MPRGAKRRLEIDYEGEAEWGSPSQPSQFSQPSQPSQAVSSSSDSAGAAAAAPFALMAKDVKALSRIPLQEQLKVVAEIIRHCLLCHSSKKPIRMARLSADVFRGKYKGAGGALMKKAQAELKRLFGYDLVVAPTKVSAKAAASGGSASSRDYMIIHGTDDAAQIAQLNAVDTDTSKAQRGLFMLIGAVLFMHEGKILETELWHRLQELGFADCQAEPLGDLKHVVKEVLIPQGYLVKEKADQQVGAAPGPADDAAHLIKLGPRGHLETNTQSITSSEAMYTFACTVMRQEPDAAQLALYRREESEYRSKGERRGEEALKNLPTDGASRSQRSDKTKSKRNDGTEKQQRGRKTNGKNKGKSSRRGKEEAEDQEEEEQEEAASDEEDGGSQRRRLSSQKRHKSR